MDLIYHRGLNCHLASIINLANLLGVNHKDAFATLWSETEFADETRYHIFVSKRVMENLNAMGVMVAPLDLDAQNPEARISQLPVGALLLVGMDTFHIPWHPVFGHFHDPHFFFAEKETAHAMLCSDPVYNQTEIRVNSSDILPFAFELCHVYAVDAVPVQIELTQEAREILRRHPETREALQAEILACKGEGRSHIPVLLKQINAMTNNRYLFRHFLHQAVVDFDEQGRLFHESFLEKWEAVRNGLYKASILRDNNAVIDEVHDLFTHLMLEEITMAEELIAKDLVMKQSDL